MTGCMWPTVSIVFGAGRQCRGYDWMRPPPGAWAASPCVAMRAMVCMHSHRAGHTMPRGARDSHMGCLRDAAGSGRHSASLHSNGIVSISALCRAMALLVWCQRRVSPLRTSLRSRKLHRSKHIDAQDRTGSMHRIGQGPCTGQDRTGQGPCTG